MTGHGCQKFSKENSGVRTAAARNYAAKIASIPEYVGNVRHMSAAAVLDIRGGIIQRAKITCSHDGSRFWRLPDAEAFVIGWKPSRETFELAAEQSIFGVGSWSRNRFQTDLYVRKIANALELAVRTTRSPN